MPRRLVLTTGEPAGIGPELSVVAAGWFAGVRGRDAAVPGDAELVLVGDRGLLAQRGALDLAALPGVSVRHVPLREPSEPGRLAVANGRYVLDTLDAAIAMIGQSQAQAIVTAPVHKGVINDAGVAFSGHTEYLQEHAGVDKVVMMLAGGGLRVALATTHLPLRAVPDAITPETLDRVLRILDADLRSRFGLAAPRIAVCGLNPHAGEGGHLGHEEIDVIAPAIGRARAAGIDAHGPLPADTLFVPSHVAQYDAALAMFHDQGLPVLKHASFGHGVNITLGLPYVRTSVDHGTALDLAGTGKADPGSLQEAILTALQMTRAGDAGAGVPA
ncbi:4-hydroxythreonine-4-phosphate dehydrogenase 1 [Pigmentiphaga humi]|uniref:4-hydroxythreonine-4-phosphate dehydrogenase n=1 Tax=Pigmentiphaga humi TaxID=2478468 RepID=A0A3P4B8Z1_9BURK|nr:4-hydroxythreonine-4-phosphate dehydrogenase PdxA [Pigmentiphaga humi]VCU72080.1 4-hydroxythreonine-4-phosphate dehydrogenase 1 [Pigmentiphaga humi]